MFRHFISPGVWEAIYVIEGLLKAGLSVKADTVHTDTQGQSATVFTFTYISVRDQADAAYSQLEGPRAVSAGQRRKIQAH
ncbi:MAG: Mobile element protein [uncultured Paraburkholderia sp.]|nr:MAG: Mobile element protein [uncultured Paraburkholderia sp.]CAH2938458.1 MAG: Mobile element protein [uncultured Paraburkholderia sp.]